MNKSIRTTIIILLTCFLIPVLAACGKSESGSVTGTLINAVEGQITIENDEGRFEIETEKETAYRLGDEDRLYVGDTVEVSYHKSMGKMHADEVILRSHIEKELVFEGTVTQVKEDELTVTGKSLTVSFVRNEETAVAGDLSVGDEVSVIYTGDLSEYPYAASITVTAEIAKPEVKTVSGIVAEFTENSILLAIDSAKSIRFTFNADTVITGAAKYAHTGDSVNIRYDGKLDESPVALEINIVKEAEKEKLTVNGTIKSVEADYLTLDTGKKVYIIHTDKNTKYTGDKPAAGYKSEITYTGNINRDALATNVYCVKKTPEPPVTYKVTFVDGVGGTVSTQTVVKGEAAKQPPNPVRKGYTFKGWDKDFSKITADLTVTALWTEEAKPAPEPTPEPEPAPEPDPDDAVIVDGTLTIWTSDGNNTFSVLLSDGGEITLTVTDATEILSGYFPKEEDQVKVMYYKSTMEARKIEPFGSSEQEDEEGDEDKPDGSGDEEPAPEPEPEPAPEPVPEPEPVQEPDVKVDTEGTIVEGDEEKQTCTIKTADGETVTLNLTKDTQISSGYFPQKDDEVRVVYTKKAMLLREIQLISRPEPVPAPEPEPAPAEEPAEPAGNGEDAAAGSIDRARRIWNGMFLI